ncbi:DMT family transporter [Halorhabdus sp. CUG00001]|uniref:DMT family transporter n=1 Tax=Halorhabdus sp. CUG00001 TaxID=2600297 RepID=UPI0018EF1654|nr:DMT family transporter [Halorhabdus sp. CUG00001]
MAESNAELSGQISPLTGLSVAIVAVSTSAILVRWSEAPSIVAAFYRVVLTTSLLAPLAFARHRNPFASFQRSHLLGATLAGLALSVHFAAWFESLAWTSVAASVTIVQSQPLLVAVGAALLLDERVTGGTVVGILVAIVGIAIMSVPDLLGGAAVGADPTYGNGLALLGAVAAAAYVLAGRSIRQRVALLPYVLVVYAVCSIGLLAVVAVQGAALSGYPPREWLLFLGMAVGPGVFGHTVLNWALAHVESSVVSVSLLAEPIGASVLALVLLAEVPDTVTIVGGVVVLTGISLTARARPNGDDL